MRYPISYKTTLKIICSLGVMSLCDLGCGACQKKTAQPITPPAVIMESYSWLAMGTIFKLDIAAASNSKDIFKACEMRVKELEKIGNPFNAKSEVSRLNKSPDRWVKVSPDLYRLLLFAQAGYLKTQGAFDITVKPAIDFFKVKQADTRYKKLPELPKEIQAVIGFNHVKIDANAHRVKLDNGTSIDLSGILKGYAVDEMRDILKKKHIEKALINAGGNIYALGTDENNRLWKIGIRDPKNKNRIIDTIDISNKAIATSAGYERYLTAGKTRFSHIYNPKTHTLVKATGGVTVVTESGIWSDIYSTALYVDPKLKLSEALQIRFYP